MRFLAGEGDAANIKMDGRKRQAKYAALTGSRAAPERKAERQGLTSNGSQSHPRIVRMDDGLDR